MNQVPFSPSQVASRWPACAAIGHSTGAPREPREAACCCCRCCEATLKFQTPEPSWLSGRGRLRRTRSPAVAKGRGSRRSRCCRPGGARPVPRGSPSRCPRPRGSSSPRRPAKEILQGEVRQILLPGPASGSAKEPPRRSSRCTDDGSASQAGTGRAPRRSSMPAKLLVPLAFITMRVLPSTCKISFPPASSPPTPIQVEDPFIRNPDFFVHDFL